MPEKILTPFIAGIVWTSCFFSGSAIVIYNTPLSEVTPEIYNGDRALLILLALFAVVMLAKGILSVINREKYETVYE